MKVWLLSLLLICGCTPHDFSMCMPEAKGSEAAFCYNTRYHSWMVVLCEKLPAELAKEAACP